MQVEATGKINRRRLQHSVQQWLRAAGKAPRGVRCQVECVGSLQDLPFRYPLIEIRADRTFMVLMPYSEGRRLICVAKLDIGRWNITKNTPRH